MGGRGASSSISKRNSIDTILNNIKAINPNYSKGKEYRVNCQACTIAFILKEQGENVEALGRKGSYWKDDKGNIITINDMFNNNPRKDYFIVGQKRFDDERNARNYATRSSYSKIYRIPSTEKSIFMHSSSAIEDEVKSWGNGASGYIHVEWKGNKGGHVFNIKNINGKVYSIDAQNGKVRDLSSTLSSAKPQHTFITRTDNLKVKEKLKKYMVKGA